MNRLYSRSPLLSVAVLSFVLVSSGATFAQTASLRPERVAAQEKSTARKAAYAAFKAGDATGAVAGLAAIVQRYSPLEKQELDLGRQLAEVSFRLKNESEASLAGQAASLALSRLQNSADRMPPKEAANAWLSVAALHEHVLGEPGLARQAYSRALSLDPSSTQAKERLAHLDANLVLQQRRQEGGRK
jgi:hypothetical protein